MKLKLTGRHIEITNHLKDHVETKFRRLDRYAEHVSETDIVLFKEGIRDVAEGKLHLSHSIITAKGLGGDMYSAVNDLVDKLAGQLLRHEGKLRDRKRHSPSTE
jgi:putative sigma-54 modulation protein